MRKVLDNKDFLALWASQILSQLTFNILSFVLLIHIFNQTHSTIAVSLMWVSYAIPALIVGPVAAATVDLFEKKKVLMISNLMQGLVVFVFSILIFRSLVYIAYAVVFLYSFFNQFYGPAEAATLPFIVKNEDLPAANSLFFITQQASVVIGFGFAGILDQFLGFRVTLMLIAICLFLAFISVRFLPKTKPLTKLPTSFEKRLRTFFDQIMEGYDFIRNTNSILFPLLLLLGVQMILMILIVILPRIAVDIVHIPTNYSSILVMLPAGVGAVLSTLLVPKLMAAKIRKLRLIIVGVVTLSFSMLILSIFVPFIQISWIRITLACILFALSGVGVVGALIPSLTFLQERTPKDLLGRVFGNFWFLTTVVTVLPMLFSATITDLFGVRLLLLMLGLGSLCAIIISTHKVKDL